MIAETIGLWFVIKKLVIPKERTVAAIWIYQFSIISFIMTLITTPYKASIIAHESMDAYAYISIVEVLLKEGHAGEKDILKLADDCLNDDKRKDLRYAIGKELAKYENSAYDEICLKYLGSKDSTTQSLGLDMYKTNKFSSAVPVMKTIYEDKKANSGVKNRIKKLLSIEDDDEKKNEKSDGAPAAK